jgi:glycosyltransferase involved in cell wall biosynthesis
MPVKVYERTYLDRAIGSLFAQTSPQWRLLVVVEPEDVASMSEVLQGVLGDERAVLVANEGRRLAGAVNTGMRHASTEFVAILLGDDMWAPRAVEVLTDHIERFPEVDFFHSGRVVVDGHDRPISSELMPSESFAVDEFAHGSPVKHLLCWRRELGLAIGGLDERIENVGPDDYDFPWSMAEAGARFRAVPEALYLYRDHRDGYRLTTHLPLSIHRRELRRIFRKHRVGRLRAYRQIRSFRKGYLRQCLYRNRLDRWLKQRRGLEPPPGWRERYR